MIYYVHLYICKHVLLEINNININSHGNNYYISLNFLFFSILSSLPFLYFFPDEKLYIAFTCILLPIMSFISYLFCQLFLTKFVKSVKFPSQYNVLNKTNTSQFDTNDNLSVRDHHSHGTEVQFQVFW